jgi:hypothetical protein
VGTSWVTVGSTGASVHTAQTRVLLKIQLIGSGSVSVVNLPVYVEIAAGTATLNTVSCGYPSMSTSKVTLGVSPGLVDAWVGDVTPGMMTNFSTAESARGEHRQSRRDPGHGQGACYHGERLANQCDVQLRGYPGTDQEDREHDFVHIVADDEPAG